MVNASIASIMEGKPNVNQILKETAGDMADRAKAVKCHFLIRVIPASIAYIVLKLNPAQFALRVVGNGLPSDKVIKTRRYPINDDCAATAGTHELNVIGNGQLAGPDGASGWKFDFLALYSRVDRRLDVTQ
jgi:hypothetical protein